MSSVLFTIFTYSIIYGGAFIIFKSADRTASASKRRWFIFIGIIYLSLFASVRDISVGTDTASTLQGYFSSRNSLQILDIFKNDGGIYVLLANIFHILHFGQHTILFCLELLILTPIAICAYMRRNQTPIYITMTLFLLIFYQISFNWIRQSIACSFLLLAYVLYQNNMIKTAVVICIFAVLFHSSASIGIALFVYAYLCIIANNRIMKFFCGSILIITIVFLFSQWDEIALWGMKVGLFPSDYAGYVRVFTGETRVERWFQVGKRTYVDYAIRILFVILPIIYSGKMSDKSENRYLEHYKMITTIALIIYSFIFLGMGSVYGNRLTYTVEYVHILNLGSCCSSKVSSKGIIPLRNLIIIGVALFYNAWLYYILAWHATVPFYFAF